ncbi:hypothetical protein U1737_01435 [Sphingomonas sp. LB3N6]|uniref:hypothetical protein n=1 Tax=Sphingomonas fucosidasi TaxID=3096164 RepID=UPI002FCC52AB
MLRTVVLAALIVLPGMAYAQDAQVDTPPQRIRSVTLTGDQKCPKSSAGEVVVCSTLDQPYRIPKSLREDKPIAAQNQSWVNRAATMDQIGRVAGGLPDTCSAVGTGGQSGCFMQRNQAFAAERRAPASETTTTP